MSFPLKLVVHNQANETGHMFCGDCATELNIDLGPYHGYRHPNYQNDWKKVYHDFHPIRVVYPGVLKLIWDGEAEFECPYCGCRNQKKFVVMDNGTFDVRLLQESLVPNNKEYECVYCEGIYAGHNNVAKFEDGYICKDCLAHMQVWSRSENV